MKKLAKITESFTESVIREMTRICDAAGGYNLSQGFPDFAADKDVKKAAVEAILKDYNQYPVTFGEPELRQAIGEKVKKYNNLTVNPDTDITVTCGATEAMIATLKAVINPGDEVVVFEPFYENYGPDAILSGAKPRYVTLYAPDWRYRPEELAAAFNNKTKAIIINTPNNPTGKVFSREELSDIAALCQKWDCLAITDEIYEHIIYDGAAHISIASLSGMAERSVTINSVSKTYSVTGWRVGWAIAAPGITARIRKVHDFLTVGAPTPLQHAAVFALNLPDTYYQKLQLKYAASRDRLFRMLTTAGFKPFLPKGAYYIIAECGDLMNKLKIKDDFAFSRELIARTKVATVPGTSFFSDKSRGKNQVRFCFCKKKETLDLVEEGLRSL
ncbi:MAG: aminotransferase class I/II-fold pyridoxal phosphate-dependent enzyme [bacterium]|nr:aminotransferase class I/II-fold pyridoxal phosphate-dependent enzyme [bacterium]